MAATPSTMVPIGTKAPYFSLPNVFTGKLVNLSEFREAKGLVVMFICNHCPYVIHLNSGIVELAKKYQEKGIAFVAMSSNDAQKYPDDAPEKMASVGQSLGYPFPYLYDESQEVAKAYAAACTPDFFVYDGQHALFYRGQFDDSRPGNGKPVTGADLNQALDDLLNGKAPPQSQRPSIGCNIKWKSQ